MAMFNSSFVGLPEGKRPVKTMENHGKSPSLISVNQGTNWAMASIAMLN